MALRPMVGRFVVVRAVWRRRATSAVAGARSGDASGDIRAEQSMEVGVIESCIAKKAEVFVASLSVSEKLARHS